MKKVFIFLLLVLLGSCQEETPIFDTDCNVLRNRYIVTDNGCSDMPIGTLIFFDDDNVLNTFIADQRYIPKSCNGGEMTFLPIDENSWFSFGYIELTDKERLIIKVNPGWYSDSHEPSEFDGVLCVVRCDRYD